MRFGFLIGFLFVTACGGGTSSTSGKASYVKPADQGGQKVAPQQKSDDFKATVSVAGAANFSAVNAALCQLTSGDFSAQATTTGSVSSDGSYASTYDTASLRSAATNPLCGALTNVKLTGVTSVTVTASMPANDTNCSGFCQAKADDQCSTSLDKASCTSTTQASCTSQCKGSSKITGSGSASASAIAAANSGTQGSGDVSATADIVFTAFQ
jgi:hypothetical protein